jgi:hypothetical protein
MKETLEEAAEKYSMELLEARTIQPHEKSWVESIFVHGAKKQTERMYSEEELFQIIAEILHTPTLREGSWEDIGEWFEQFKKK